MERSCAAGPRSGVIRGQVEMMQQETRDRVKLWAKRFGWTALAFYTVKGLCWLLVGWGAWSALK